SCGAVAYCPDGELLATAGREKVIRLWDPGRGVEVRTLPVPKRAGGLYHCVNTLTFSPDSKLLVAGSTDNPIHCWSLADNKYFALAGHERGIWALSFTPEGRFLLSGSEDGTARIWSVADRKEIR